MISLAAADKILNTHTFFAVRTQTPLPKAGQEISRETVRADRDVPAYDRAMMDGIAVRAADIKKHDRLMLKGFQKAGAPPLRLKKGEPQACEIATGAILPMNADTVIPYEDILIRNNNIYLKSGAVVKKGLFVHKKSSDAKKGATVIPCGSVLTPRHLAVLASCGKTKINVSRKPRIAVLSIGDELKPEKSRTLKDYEIRASNGILVKETLKQKGFPLVKTFTAKDNKTVLTRCISRLMKQFEIIITLGCLSKGQTDFIPAVLKNARAEIFIQGIKQKPGKPFLFAKKQNTYFFGLPGNPVSAQICLHRHVLPFLYASLGMKRPAARRISLFKKASKNTSRALLMPVKLTSDFQAEPRPFRNSGEYLSLTDTDGFVELVRSAYKKGDRVRFYPW